MIRLLFVVPFFLISCTKDPSQPNVEIIQDMMEQPALKAQDFHPQDREKSSMLPSPKGTQPKNKSIYLYSGQPKLAEQKLVNPYGDSPSKEVLERGKIHFNNFCMVCHGEKGRGDGPVSKKWMLGAIPSLMSEDVRNHKDGMIFHVITDGQGLMGTYIHQLPEPKDRWAVVSYIRKLQGK